jgi:hypothetical protein
LYIAFKKNIFTISSGSKKHSPILITSGLHSDKKFIVKPFAVTHAMPLSKAKSGTKLHQSYLRELQFTTGSGMLYHFLNFSIVVKEMSHFFTKSAKQ